MATAARSTRDIILRTSDWQQAREFYGNVLGFEVTYEDDRIIGFETGSIQLFIEKGESHGPVLELLVPDVETAKRDLLAAGCLVQEEDPAVPKCYLRDPYGLVFNLGRARPG
ncbi:MAG TPA: VOC family protein [Thermoanaerobaculia bacterium]|nr:VOC family protein [Thermoanaerobaculia bacterium]